MTSKNTVLQEFHILNLSLSLQEKVKYLDIIVKIEYILLCIVN